MRCSHDHASSRQIHTRADAAPHRPYLGCGLGFGYDPGILLGSSEAPVLVHRSADSGWLHWVDSAPVRPQQAARAVRHVVPGPGRPFRRHTNLYLLVQHQFGGSQPQSRRCCIPGSSPRPVD